MKNSLHLQENYRMRQLFLILLSFITLGLNAQTYVVNEDFQNGIPGTWKVVINDTSNAHPDVAEFTSAWIIKENPDTVGDSVIASTSYFENGGIASRWIISPQIQLGGFGNWIGWDAKSHDPSFPDGYKVLISTTNDSLHNFTDTVFLTDFELPYWTEREIQLPDSTYAGLQIYVAFVNDSDDQYILYLDNMKFRTDDPLGINEYDPEIVSTVYPNPFNNQIKIRSEFEVKALELRSITGALIKSYLGEVYELNGLSTIEPGTYFLRVLYKNGLSEIKKLIKE